MPKGRAAAGGERLAVFARLLKFLAPGVALQAGRIHFAVIQHRAVRIQIRYALGEYAPLQQGNRVIRRLKVGGQLRRLLPELLAVVGGRLEVHAREYQHAHQQKGQQGYARQRQAQTGRKAVFHQDSPASGCSSMR